MPLKYSLMLTHGHRYGHKHTETREMGVSVLNLLHWKTYSMRRKNVRKRAFNTCTGVSQTLLPYCRPLTLWGHWRHLPTNFVGSKIRFVSFFLHPAFPRSLYLSGTFLRTRVATCRVGVVGRWTYPLPGRVIRT